MNEMNAAERAEILDRLAAGQISVSEAMRQLDRTAASASVESLKAEELAADAIPVEELKAEEAVAIRMPEEPAILKEAIANGNTAPADGKPRWLKIRVRDTASDNNKVTVSLPLGLVSFGLGIAQRFSADMAGVNTDEIMALLKSGQRGVLVEVQDDEDNEHVQIYVD